MKMLSRVTAKLRKTVGSTRCFRLVSYCSASGFLNLRQCIFLQDTSHSTSRSTITVRYIALIVNRKHTILTVQECRHLLFYDLRSFVTGSMPFEPPSRFLEREYNALKKLPTLSCCAIHWDIIFHIESLRYEEARYCTEAITKQLEIL